MRGVVTERIISWFENRKKENARMEEQWNVIRPPAKYGITATVVFVLYALSLIFHFVEINPGYLNGASMIVFCYFLVIYVLGGFSRKITHKTRFQIFAVLLLLMTGVFFMRSVILHSKFWLIVGCVLTFVGSYLFRKIKLEFVEGGEK